MKKILIISSFLMVMMSFSMIGYKMVSATEKVDEIEEQLEFQKKQEKYFSPYGYTLDNPNIIENPYANSPLTALILFETDYSTKVTVKILSKENSSLENTYSEDTKHIIPIYGLYPNTENKIEIIEKNIKDKTINEEVIVQAGYTKFQSDKMKIIDLMSIDILK